MGATRTDHYSDIQNDIAKIAKALGHPARVAIVEYLVKTNACICGDIVNELPLAQPTVSQHLKELKNAGLIKGNIEGNAICYCINEKTFNTLKEYFSEIIFAVTGQKCC
ncbi:MAG: metalloregulator ArsR/SmtB family transcription factor [Tannerella sp.]|jgi:DNA-binding transcriptional ArsR family regulator|nr:metalloregulator ArsR/SmtB family transcription factor [Tannerella sp.]